MPRRTTDVASGSARGREGIVREADTPAVTGQLLRVEDREGVRWEVECRGEPVATGALILFEAIGEASRQRGELLRVLDGRREEWVCRLRRRAGRIELEAFAGLSMPALHLIEKDARGAADGDRVVVIPKKQKRKATKQKRRNARVGARGPAQLDVRVLEVLGPAGHPDSDHRAVVWKHRLTRDFPRRARLEAESFAAEWSEEESERRLDLRHLPFITIDPATARDHDDAVFAERRGSGPLGIVDANGSPGVNKRDASRWAKRLWVAIADVAHFVPRGSALDAEARRRGNSFYFPDRAIPMLPERLSSGLCSLRPNVDRLAMVAELRLLEDGRVADALFHEAIIRSHARLSYEEAAAALDSPSGSSIPEPTPGGPPADERQKSARGSSWLPSLRLLGTITDQLSAQRRADGALSLDLPEVAIRLDANGAPIDSVLRERNPAHGLIEEAMLAANRAVAAALDRSGRPTIHRVHPPPRSQRLESLRTIAARAGLEIARGADLSDPRTLARLLEAAKDSPSGERIHTAVLRSLSQARYAAQSGGHHALCFEHYLHFTSPIRRYADLEVHRALKHLLRSSARRETPPTSERVSSVVGPPSTETLSRIALWLSGRERVAVEVERDAIALASCAILRGREGERFRARVQSVSEFGLFVRVEKPVVDGLVPMRTLDGLWEHDPDDEWLIGPRNGQRFGVGDTLDVELMQIDADRGRLAFRWVQKSRPSKDDASRRAEGVGRTVRSRRAKYR